MPKFEISQKANAEWEESLKPDDFLSNQAIVDETKTFFKGYDSGDDNRKIELIKSYIKTIADFLNIKYSKVFVISDGNSSTAGSYCNATKEIFINLKKKGGYYEFSSEVLLTILHELRHAYQNQYIMNQNSDFGKMMKYYSEHYTQPGDNNYFQEIGYVTNFSEVDAQRFAFSVGRALAEDGYNRSKNESILSNRIMKIKLNGIISSQKSFEERYSRYFEILQKSDEITQSLLQHNISSAISYLNSDSKFNENEKIGADLVSNDIMDFINSNEIQQVVCLSMNDIKKLYIDILSNVKCENIVSKLNSSLTETLKYIGEKLRNNHIDLKTDSTKNSITYDYIQRLEDGVEFGKIFLDKLGVKYDVSNNVEIYKKYSDEAINYISDVFKKQETDEFDSALVQNINDLSNCDLDNFSKDRVISQILKKNSEKDIRKILESNFDSGRNNFVIEKLKLNNELLNGYGNSYSREKTFGFYSKFLNYCGIESKDDFSEIYDKFNEYYPKYFTKCINKKELTIEDENFLYMLPSLIENGKPSKDDFVKEIKSNFSDSKIKNLLKKDNLAVKILKTQEMKLVDSEENQKDIEQYQ